MIPGSAQCSITLDMSLRSAVLTVISEVKLR